MKVCTLLQDPPAGGGWNMAVDEALLEGIGEFGPTLRLYRWSPATLSLGYFQVLEDRRLHPPSLSCPVVRRPTGGGAILHDAELTYALVLPAEDMWTRSREKLYFAVHRAIATALRYWAVDAIVYNPAELPCIFAARGFAGSGHGQVGRPEAVGGRQPDLDSAKIGCTAAGEESANQPFMCFARRSCGDLLVGSEKIAGSAQRRTKAGILQHGSILLARSPFAPEFPGLAELLGRPIGLDEFADAFVAAIAEELKCRMVPGSLPSKVLARAQELLSSKYGHPLWTGRSFSPPPKRA